MTDGTNIGTIVKQDEEIRIGEEPIFEEDRETLDVKVQERLSKDKGTDPSKRVREKNDKASQTYSDNVKEAQAATIGSLRKGLYFALNAVGVDTIKIETKRNNRQNLRKESELQGLKEELWEAYEGQVKENTNLAGREDQLREERASHKEAARFHGHLKAASFKYAGIIKGGKTPEEAMDAVSQEYGQKIGNELKGKSIQEARFVAKFEAFRGESDANDALYSANRELNGLYLAMDFGEVHGAVLHEMITRITEVAAGISDYTQPAVSKDLQGLINNCLSEETDSREAIARNKALLEKTTGYKADYLGTVLKTPRVAIAQEVIARSNPKLGGLMKVLVASNDGHVDSRQGLDDEMDTYIEQRDQSEMSGNPVDILTRYAPQN